MTLRSAYPIPPLRESGYVAVAPPHRLFWQRRGAARGRPAVVFHGGPGTGTTDNLFQLFAPDRFDVVAFDQRGAGRSEPFGELGGNTLDVMVSDAEEIRTLLGIERWLVVGGSWGSTLALRYAETYPEAVERIVLWGTWLFRPVDIEWYLYGARPIMPEAWSAYAAAAGHRDGGDLLADFAAKLFDKDPKVHKPAAVAWKTFERLRGTLVPRRDGFSFPADRQTLNMARIMVHFCRAGMRGEGSDTLGDASRLNGIPGTVVHGRYDLVCPFDNARRLADVWTDGQLVEIAGAGHSLAEPKILDAVVRAVDG